MGPLAVAEASTRAADAPARALDKRMTLVVFSGDMDKLLAALSIATTAAATGSGVTLFFTFWGISALRRRKRLHGKRLHERLLNLLLPGRNDRTQLSRMNMLGVGPRFFRWVMARKNVADVDELVETARAVGVRMVACTMSMDVMGICQDELIDGVELAGAAACVRDLFASDATLFV